MLTLKSISSVLPETTLWDEGKGAVSGFGARRQKSATVSYILKFRTTDGRQRWHTIGRHGSPWTPDLARVEARRILGEVTTGVDPAAQKQEMKRAATIAELCDRYISDAGAGRVLNRRKQPMKTSSIDIDRGRVERHIKPLLGSRKAASITRRDVERLKDDIAEGVTAARVKTRKFGLARVTGGRGTSTRTLSLLSAIFTFAIRHGIRSDNPVRGVVAHGYKQRERRLTDGEFGVLGKALRSMPDSTWPFGTAAIKFIALTGWRRGEVLGLRWSEVDLDRRTARLTDTKTGGSVRPLSRASCDLLANLQRLGPLAFPRSSDPEKPMAGFRKVWLRVAAQARLPADVTPHVLRHTYASVAADLGYSELTIAALLGHRKASITSRYAHFADATMLAAADAVADHIAGLIGDSANRETPA